MPVEATLATMADVGRESAAAARFIPLGMPPCTGYRRAIERARGAV
jgi:hypothetical protein